MKSFQDIIFTLEKFWGNYGCVILSPYDLEVGAGTFHPATIFGALRDRPWKAAYVQPCRRPQDGRYGDNPNRLQRYYQFQVILKPSPENSQELYLKSLEALGIHPLENDIRFVEDDWESPTLGAWGLGWEVWCNGIEISQYTYFQQVGGMDCRPVPVELTYGLERIAMVIQGVNSVYDLNWNGGEGEEKITYRDVSFQAEREFSAYHFDYASTQTLFKHFQDAETECAGLLKRDLSLPAYDQCMKASHIFNILDARGVVSVNERPNYIARVREMAKECCKVYVESEKKGN